MFSIQVALRRLAVFRGDIEIDAATSVVRGGDLDHNLMFSGHNAYKFKQDPFYSNGFVPTVGELVQRIMTGS